jgi:predicted dithiol-disulfide oxidoreductase (DUF899 family)
MEHKIVSREAWLDARKGLLARERAMTHALDTLRAERRALPWVRVDKRYVFAGPDGELTLADLFGDRSQLAIYHFMLAPGSGHICSGCAFTVDHVDAARRHFEHADLAFAAVSRAPIAEIETARARMGWTFPWVSSHGSDFNYDFHATLDERVAPVLFNFRDEAELARRGTPWTPAMRGDWPGISAFLRDGETVYHTYSTFARGIDSSGATSYYLDLTALGRQEAWEEPKGRADVLGTHAGGPDLRFHDEYGPADGA